MLIGICGSICAGKSTVAQYLVECHGFTRLYIGCEGSAADASPVSSTSSPTVFPSAGTLLDFVTTRWRERWVTTDVAGEATLDVLVGRPFFLLISVDAPLAVRWRRAQARAVKSGGGIADEDSVSLDDFVVQSDLELYGGGDAKHPPLLPVMARSAMRLVNGAPGGFSEASQEPVTGPSSSSSSALSASPTPALPSSAASPPTMATLFAALEKAGLTAAGVEQLLRPSWDRYFMSLASLAAQRSNCMKRRVGCVLVREHRVVSTGYNGTPRGLRNCGEGGCGRCNGGFGAGLSLATCLCLHAEENALLEAGRERIPTASLANTILYCDTCPCLTCSIKIVQVGIGEVVYSQGYSMDADTAAVFREAGVQLRQFVPPAQGLIHLEKIEL
ncbi:deoxycytidylate deaminase [Grosmannia clavigera kw1407]|uniref:Deoxycytidylate deaminase n=1 Tax=Grosmannia clavigera (strain kw1407 / UAMH 11150) TaxID=655863 RepID=F0XCR4_GROCL|nr:deoxycytidylate deaminase [Grosmannia clavigera kw1407]EFX03626.1 deoxycytidylate deaminase [Grosmannia clavigera kw1407]